jgi:lysophospholipase L1-like esterase
MSLACRLARPLLRAVLPALLGCPALAQQFADFPPDHPGISYSDYACAHVDPQRASFDRDLPSTWVCHQEEMSPGVRASFVAQATHVRFELEYLFAGFTCGSGVPVPLSWEFGLVIDGVRRSTGARNPLYPLTQGSTPWINLGQGGPHQITLIWPSGADVDLRRLHLKDMRPDSAPVLLAPPVRSVPQLTVFGESITQGLSATHVLNTYPMRLGAAQNWRVVNLGFAGRTTVPNDAWLAAGFPGCRGGLASSPDLLLLAIGSNDFHLLNDVHTKVDKFEDRYEEWLDQFRSLQPTIPILCLTPLPRGDECAITTRTMEQYRERIRAVIEERADPRIYLFEGRDLIALPPAPGDPLFDAALLHPTDLGFEQIAERLNRFNLVRNPGFELRPLLNCGEVAEPEPYLWTSTGPGTSTVTLGPGGRTLALSTSAARSQVVYGLSEGDSFSLKASGLATSTGSPGRVTMEFLDASGALVAAPFGIDFNQNTWRRFGRQGTAPAGTIRARLTLAKSPGAGQFLVDDLELTVIEF